jgi:hypothetical protein
LYNSKNNNQPMEFRQVRGGDGFDAEISFYNPAVCLEQFIMVMCVAPEISVNLFTFLP